MRKPDDITEAAWAEALSIAASIPARVMDANRTFAGIVIARALMVAEARGRAEEREACANEALMYGGV